MLFGNWELDWQNLAQARQRCIDVRVGFSKKNSRAGFQIEFRADNFNIVHNATDGGALNFC